MDLFTSGMLFFIVLIGYWIQSISGFGAMVFALPLSLFFIDKLLFIPVILFMSVIHSLAVAYKDRKYIDRKKFLIMLALAAIGTPLGMVVTDYLNESIANYLLGVFIIFNSGNSLYKYSQKKQVCSKMKGYYYIYPIFSGLLQTAYGVGGPLIGSYMDKQTQEKRTYRGMISLYWCILNPFIIIGYFLRGNIGLEHQRLFLLLFPAVLLGYFLGNFTIDKISQNKFKYITDILLISIGFTLFF